MNFIKRALLSVKARKGKSLLQIFIFTVICVLVISGLAIQTAATKSADMARQSLGGNVTLQLDTEKMMEQKMQGGGLAQVQREPIPLDDVEELTAYSHIKGYNLYASSMATANGFNPIEFAESEGENDLSSNPLFSSKLATLGNLTLQGVLYTDSVQEFMDADSKLVEGRHITDEDKDSKVVLIEKNLAKENDLKLGDKINITSASEQSFEFEIVGIYETSAQAEDMTVPLTALNPYNKLYLPYPSVNEIKGEEFKNTIDRAVFFMDDPENIEDFVSQAKEKSHIDFDTFKLDANDQLYQQMVGPIDHVASFSKNVVYMVTIAGAIILGLIVMMSIRERKYEMGVLLSLGEKKWKLIGQFIVEILVVAILALGISSISGHAVANQVGNQLLENQLKNEETSSSPASFARPGGLLLGGMSAQQQEADPIETLDIEITGKDFGLLAMIGFLIAIFSTLIPSLSVLRLQPKTILTKQD